MRSKLSLSASGAFSHLFLRRLARRQSVLRLNGFSPRLHFCTILWLSSLCSLRPKTTVLVVGLFHLIPIRSSGNRSWLGTILSISIQLLRFRRHHRKNTPNNIDERSLLGPHVGADIPKHNGELRLHQGQVGLRCSGFLQSIWSIRETPYWHRAQHDGIACCEPKLIGRC